MGTPVRGLFDRVWVVSYLNLADLHVHLPTHSGAYSQIRVGQGVPVGDLTSDK